MNAGAIISDDMTLEEKLKAIDKAIKAAAEKFNIENGRPVLAPVDPASLTICDGCE